MSRETSSIEVEVNGVAFAYPDQVHAEVISDISLRISPGQAVAIIGPSGGGKSTLASLILGLLAPSRGQILLNGLPPRQYISSNPGAVALVEQSTSLIRASIAENVALGVSMAEIDADQLNVALESAELMDWVNQLADGVLSVVDPGRMSGGQLQRLGLARALYTKPSLLVLDEPTSALDADTEHKISQTLERLRGKITQISIAHRLTTIENADRVFLLEDGKISDSGTFSELRKSSATVAALVDRLSFKN